MISFSISYQAGIIDWLISYSAAIHRVKNCNSSRRYSWPFFFDPTWDVQLSKIETFDDLNTENDIEQSETMHHIGNRKLRLRHTCTYDVYFYLEP